MKTITAAASQDYPETSYQVFVLDDGRSENLRKAVEDFNRSPSRVNSTHLPVVYLARDKAEGSTNYKSGNLRFGLDRTRKCHGGSRYIAALDADMLPEPSWLARTVRPLENDNVLAMAGPPQHFSNVPTNDILGQETGIFQQVLEPLRSRFGCSQCCGSGYVMRREALESIGGFPLCNLNEDIVCSYTLMEAGWKMAHINENLQSGVLGDSFHSYVAQRIRWVN
jgi:cellulose synthase/poly-beta-1,6-N-acetylglucosamine synthase-like glycosyltransferase